MGSGGGSGRLLTNRSGLAEAGWRSWSRRSPGSPCAARMRYIVRSDARYHLVEQRGVHLGRGAVDAALGVELGDFACWPAGGDADGPTVGRRPPVAGTASVDQVARVEPLAAEDGRDPPSSVTVST